MNGQARLVGIQVGRPIVHGHKDAQDPLDQPWRTGFFKLPVSGPVWLGRTNLFGDGQGNRRVHGGPDKAVLAYSANHYLAWRRELTRPDLPYGAFAENFTVDGLVEDTVCIGDVHRVGDAGPGHPAAPAMPEHHASLAHRTPDRVRCGNGPHRWYSCCSTGGIVEAARP
jgi:hypothetical protein